ncbi:hypothetical protein BAUCODRAFT_222411 [Baudoinia panamericana UAMH 10762]|uniref:Uncharacterized protein n=1 Tax=Baudoinia panamericana (strain UAMH 10762) TaxID=717646 RepID=M2MCB0_BAUPA|nr:uncharacterized protein BAUCODRAFT_222411 [Baudoinia panamericana UAMH 10762]EMC94151.1 hypothetical protein BAUCODRAFT_222411 [Baudoinia panamericana UAMH 10762]
MWIAVEAFLDGEEGVVAADGTPLERFHEFIADLGTQPVTVTISSLVNDMLRLYHDCAANGTRFSYHADVASFVESFVLSRDCFFYPERRAPVVEATFQQCHFSDGGREVLDVQIFYSWAQPLLGFRALANVVAEGEEFVLAPVAPNARVYGAVSPCSAEYFVGPAEDWLRWDADRECLHGTVPPHLAANQGAERLDCYTMGLEIMAIITKHFAGDIRLERVIRCGVPLTVRRRPDRCTDDEEMVMSPPLRTLQTRVSPCRGKRTSPHSLRRTESYRKLRTGHQPPAKPLFPSFASSASTVRRPTPVRAYSGAVVDTESEIENGSATYKEISQTLERKAECMSPASSPLMLNPLSLARLYENSRPVRSDGRLVFSRGDGVVERLRGFDSDA